MNIDQSLTNFLHDLDDSLACVNATCHHDLYLSDFNLLPYDIYIRSELDHQIHSLYNGKTIPLSRELSLATYLLSTISAYQSLSEYEYIFNGLGLNRAAYLVHQKLSSWRYILNRSPSLNIFYLARYFPSLRLRKFFCFLFLQTQKWTSYTLYFFSCFAIFRRYSSFLTARHFLHLLFFNQKVGIFCPGPYFEYSCCLQSDVDIFLVFNFIPSSSQLHDCRKLNKSIVIVLAQRKVKELVAADISLLQSSLVSAIFVKTSHDYSSLVNLGVDKSKVCFTPRVLLSNAELNVAIDLLVFIFTCHPKRVYFFNATLYTRSSANMYLPGYHRSSIQPCQFAWHSPYIQFAFIKLLGSFDNILFDSYLQSIADKNVDGFLSLL